MLKASVPVWAIYALLGYLILFMLVTGGLYLWRTARRKERPPEKFKLLRGPGETQRRRVQIADENLFFYVFGGAFVPVLIAWSVLLLAVYLPKRLILFCAAMAVVCFIASTIGATILLFRFLHRRRNDLLGYLGERAVAEFLEPLREQGFRVFHDVPCEGRRTNFNIDHVAVGPTGVSVIETKTRRKKRGREGYEEHVVTYDGQRLIWPWGEDTCGIRQVRAQADWLRDFVATRTGLRIDPKPVLAFPGWLVKERAVSTFRVANHKVVPSIVREWKPQPLTPEQIDLISRQLDERCRDVED
jgi:hypothetical protein